MLSTPERLQAGLPAPCQAVEFRCLAPRAFAPFCRQPAGWGGTGRFYGINPESSSWPQPALFLRTSHGPRPGSWLGVGSRERGSLCCLETSLLEPSFTTHLKIQSHLQERRPPCSFRGPENIRILFPFRHSFPILPNLTQLT